MTNLPVVYFPDGKPAPILLTAQETMILLRLDTVDIKNPEGTLRRYRDCGLLRATQISKRIFYYLPEILSFIERQTATVSR